MTNLRLKPTYAEYSAVISARPCVRVRNTSVLRKRHLYALTKLLSRIPPLTAYKSSDVIPLQVQKYVGLGLP